MKRLGLLRKTQGLSQQQLAWKLGISASAIGMYEQGRREPSYETLREIAAYFDVTTDYLLGLDQPAETTADADHAELADALLQQLMQQNALMFHANDLSNSDYIKISHAVRQAVDIVLERKKQAGRE